MNTLHMSKKEVDRFDVIRRLIRKEINGTRAAVLLRLTTRQIRTLKTKVKKNGAAGLIHGNRGKPSHHALPNNERAKIVKLLHTTYKDFTPTFAAEKLMESHKITRDPKTIRSIMVAEDLWSPRKGKNREHHRQWRKRKEAYGEMVQFDGSYHDWYEGRGTSPEQCILAAIDDATGEITRSSFSAHEGVFPVFAFWKAYLMAQGKPRCIYLDKFSTYKMNHKIAMENPDLKTQFQRVCQTLGIELIFANSPQAKGRVERLFGTLQDRLVKELRLQRIATNEKANLFLHTTYLPKFNRQFAVQPESSVNLHRPLTKNEKKHLDSIFARHTERTVQNDFTFSFNSQWYQLTATQAVVVRKKERVTVESWLDGTIHIRLRGKELNYIVLPHRPKKATETTPWVLAQTPERVPNKPAADHPWKRTFLLQAHRVKSHSNS